MIINNVESHAKYTFYIKGVYGNGASVESNKITINPLNKLTSTTAAHTMSTITPEYDSDEVTVTVQSTQKPETIAKTNNLNGWPDICRQA